MRKLHKEQLNIVRVIKLRMVRWRGYMACIEEERDTYRVFVGKHEALGQLGRSGNRWGGYC